MNTTTTLPTCQSLTEVRENMERIDQQIVELIAQRSHFVEQATEFKTSMDEVTDSKRIEANIGRIKNLAKQYNLDESIIEDVYRTMMDAFIKKEVRKFDPVYEQLKKSYY